MKKILVVLAMVMLAGCGKKTPADSGRDTYSFNGYVYWGIWIKSNVPVELTRWLCEDTTVSKVCKDTSFTDPSGIYIFKFYYPENSIGSFSFKIRAKDSLGSWSDFQYGTIEKNDTAVVDFLL